MTIERHGLSMGIERIGDEFFMTFTAVGTLTHEDYAVITPMIDSALEGYTQPKVKMLADLTQLEGWELRAAWDDFRIALKHGNQFSKVAIVGNKKWQEWASKVGNWFMSGEVKYFEDTAAAINWLQES